MNRPLALVLLIGLVAGCSKDETPATVGNLRSRGLKDPDKDTDMKAKPTPGQPGGKPAKP